MIRKGLMIGVAVLVLLGTSAGCAADLEQPPEAPNINLEQPPEAPNINLEQPPEAPNIDVVQPTEEANTFTIQGRVIVDAHHYDAATGTYVRFYHHEGHNDLTTIGLNWIETQLGDFDNSTTDTARYISLSNDAGPVVAGWLVIPGEIVVADANGLDRQIGAYSTTGGDGAWEISYQFTATDAVTAQLTGLQWGPIGTDNLMAAKLFPSVTLAALDTLTITWQLSVGP